jgi:hypothetical protein
LVSLADLRAPTLSLSVTRGDGGVEDEFELFMQLSVTYFNYDVARWHAPTDLTGLNTGSRMSEFTQTQQLPPTLLYSMSRGEYRIMDPAVV